MDCWANKIAIVTGASGGIGRAIAELLVANGLRVVGIDLNIDKIKILAEEWKSCSGKFIALQCDMANDNEILRTLDWIEQNLGVPEILINNAAINLPMSIIETSPDDWRKILNVSVLGPAVLMQGMLKCLKKKGLNSGLIIKIHDICSLYTIKGDASPVPISMSYLATRNALRGLNDTLRLQLARSQSNVKVISIIPGLVQAEITDQLLKNKSQLALKPKDVADAILLAIKTPENVLLQDIVITPTPSII